MYIKRTSMYCDKNVYRCTTDNIYIEMVLKRKKRGLNSRQPLTTLIIEKIYIIQHEIRLLKLVCLSLK